MTQFPSHWKDLNVILAHDWLTGMRGGERVLEILCRGFPDAPVYTLIHNPSAVSNTINRHPITTSWLQHVPWITKHYRRLLPFFPAAVESMKPGQADLLISTSHCVAKGLQPRKGTKHLCYCFTPMRYVWLFHDEYLGRNRFKRMMLSPVLNRLKSWDRTICERVDRFVTLSRHVQKRVRDYYGREADVVYPPVNTEFWTPDPTLSNETRQGRDLGKYDLIVSALTPYKRIDLAVTAYNKSGSPLIIVGTGPEFRRLRALAGKNVEFTGWVSDERVRELYRHCRALIFPGEEDFGIAPVEVQACGRPVVAFARGGVLESAKQGITGVFFNEQTEESLVQAVEQCTAQSWNPDAIRANAERFSEDHFIQGLAQSIDKCLNQ